MERTTTRANSRTNTSRLPLPLPGDRGPDSLRKSPRHSTPTTRARTSSDPTPVGTAGPTGTTPRVLTGPGRNGTTGRELRPVRGRRANRPCPNGNGTPMGRPTNPRRTTTPVPRRAPGTVSSTTKVVTLLQRWSVQWWTRTTRRLETRAGPRADWDNCRRRCGTCCNEDPTDCRRLRQFGRPVPGSSPVKF